MMKTFRFGGGAALAALALVVATARPVAAQDDPARLLSRGRDAYEAGDFDAAREALWAYLDATARVTGPSRLPQAEALWYIALMEPDAGVAANHYRTIVEEYPAASVADQALFRLAVFDLVGGDGAAAREKLDRLSRDYPFSRTQPEIPMWVGRSWLAEGDEPAAIQSFLQGYTKVKSQDLPTELPGPQRDALAAEYAYWLAAAYAQEGDPNTARQYYTLLTLDYPESPQAADAREALARMGREGPGGPVATRPAAEPAGGRDEPAAGARAEAPAPEPAAENPPLPRAGEADAGERTGDAVADLEVVDRGEDPGADAAREEPPAREVARVEPPPAEPAGGEPAPVEPAAPPRRGPEVRVDEPAKFPAPAARGDAWLQVGAFSSATNAADLSKRLKADGFDTRVEVGIVDGQGYYRVRVGPFALPDEQARLEETRTRLDGLGYPTRQVSAEE